MKTIFTTFALSLALCAAAGATAQVRSAAPVPAADTVMLSETTDGDYLVRRFIVKRQDDTDYRIRYQINLAKLSSKLDGNTRELDGLNNFVANLMQDTLMNVKSVEITGYSSPDGPVKFNRTLAENRAADFRNYVDKKYGFSKKYDVTVNSVAEDWEMCRALVAQSAVPDKQAVLNILDGSQSPDAKEQALKKMPSAWEYMVKNILPPLRRVELTINYGAGNIVEQRTMIPKPKVVPQPEQACEPCRCEVVDETITGIIVEMPGSDVDFRKDMRDAGSYSKKELREAGRIAREQERAARKIAKKEAKAAMKAEKAAKKSYRELEKM
ncbi:hypothetical protein [Alistipes sp.]|uniref:hypothetical protein n=1 Tax=Alistipes sp. TaxID=1872444 RepID=UPI003AB19193